jgi:hypothetical protein
VTAAISLVLQYSHFKLAGKYTEAQCSDCHINNVFKGTAQACSICHNMTRWSPAQFNLAHPEPNTGGEGGRGINYGGAGCRACHTSSLVSAACTSCHDSNNPGEDGGGGGDHD